MTRVLIPILACLFFLALPVPLRAQTTGTRVPEGSGPPSTPPSDSPAPAASTEPDQSPAPDTPPAAPAPRSLVEILQSVISQQEDRDGPINTDRPTFTPANTTVPKGRLQIESGWTYNYEHAGKTRDNVYDFPELSFRYGLNKYLEFRTNWLGQTYDNQQTRRDGPWHQVGGGNDMEVGFKWQLFPGDPERKWIPTTALITSIYAPTGGTSVLSNQTVEPYINLIWGFSVTKKLTLSGAIGYLGFRQQSAPGTYLPADNYQRYHQSVVAFYSATERSTLFYEWYIFEYTSAMSNLPSHYMDGGLLYRITPNMQFDIRAGFGLSGRPNDFFTGTGFSVRF